MEVEMTIVGSQGKLNDRTNLNEEADIRKMCDEEAAEDCQAGLYADCCESNWSTGPSQCCDGHWVHEQRDQQEQQEGMEYTSCVMCRAEFYKQWSAESICDECEEATQAAQEDDRIAMARQLRQALEAAELIVEQTDEEQRHGHTGGDSEQYEMATVDKDAEEAVVFMREHGKRETKEEGDHNCCFRAISAVVGMGSRRHREVRKQCVDMMRLDNLATDAECDAHYYQSQL
jgi:hypothetical protein